MRMLPSGSGTWKKRLRAALGCLIAIPRICPVWMRSSRSVSVAEVVTKDRFVVEERLHVRSVGIHHVHNPRRLMAPEQSEGETAL